MMPEGDLKQARQLMNQGFYYDNLIQMARCCRDDGLKTSWAHMCWAPFFQTSQTSWGIGP